MLSLYRYHNINILLLNFHSQGKTIKFQYLCDNRNFLSSIKTLLGKSYFTVYK